MMKEKMEYHTPLRTIRGEKAAYLCGVDKGIGQGYYLLSNELIKLFPHLKEHISIALMNVEEDSKIKRNSPEMYTK
jgi:hypothetical protein